MSGPTTSKHLKLYFHFPALLDTVSTGPLSLKQFSLSSSFGRCQVWHNILPASAVPLDSVLPILSRFLDFSLILSPIEWNGGADHCALVIQSSLS